MVKNLQTEIDQYFEENEGVSFAGLSKLEYLQGCINETLRLYPAVPSGVQRMTPPEGLQVDETFIPGNTIVQVPTYTLQRGIYQGIVLYLSECQRLTRVAIDERSFAQPNDFIPERWTTKPELTKDASVFTPFSMGK